MIRRTFFHPVLTILFFFLVLLVIAPALANEKNGDMERTCFHDASPDNSSNIQLGPRPFFLVEDMEAGELKSKLARFGTSPFRKTSFSIGHRGAPLQLPEHIVESYRAAARMGRRYDE